MEERRQKQKEYLLGWLGAVDNRQDYEVYTSDHISGTSEWLLEEEDLKSWLSTDHSDVFWLAGKAGTGKTYLATHLITHLTQTQKHVVYFYCQYDDPAKRTTLGILRSLSAQLLERIPLPDDYRAVYEEYRKTSQAGLNDVETAVTGLEILLRCLPWRVHVVIDGLDEVTDRDALTIALERLCHKARRGITKWFLTSQNVSQYWRLGKYECKLLDISTQGRGKMEKDIKRMIDQYNWAASDEAENALLSRAEGNILWANLALRTLDKEHMAVREEYDRIQIIEELEPGIFQAFLRSLKRWTERPANEMKLGRIYLNFIATAARPFTSDELDDAIGFGREGLKTQQPEWYNRRDSAMLFYRTSVRAGHCALLQHVKCRKTGKTIIRLRHKQFREFMSLDPATEPYGCKISPRTSTFFLKATIGTESFIRGDLGLSCFYYLLGNERYRTSPDQGYHDLNPGSLPNEEFDKLLDNRTHSFLVYAATHWYIHASDWNEEMQKHYATEILRFIDSDNFLFTTRVQARRAGHLLSGNCNHFLLPSWLKSFDTEEAKRIVWQYELFIEEWGHVLATSLGDFNRVATYDGSYPWFFSRHNKALGPTYANSYTRHSLATVIGPSSLQSHRRTFDSNGCLRKEHESIPHARISALHSTGEGTFSPEMMILDSEARALELTWSDFRTTVYNGTNKGVKGEHMIVEPPNYNGKEPAIGPVTKTILLPEHIVIPENGHAIFRVETARKGSKVAISIVYPHKELDGDAPTGSTAFGVFDLEGKEGTDSEIAWFDLSGLQLQEKLADTSTPVFHPTQPLVLWALTSSELIAANYETGQVDTFMIAHVEDDEDANLRYSGGLEEGEDTQQDDDSDDGSEPDDTTGADDNHAIAMGLHFTNLENETSPNLLVAKLTSTPKASTLLILSLTFPTSVDSNISNTTLSPINTQAFTWATKQPIPSPFLPSPYTLTMTSSHFLLTFYSGIDITLFRFAYTDLQKEKSERTYESLITNISLPTSSREPTGIWRSAPKTTLITGSDINEPEVKNDILVLGLKSDNGVEESVAWLLVGRERWEPKPVVPEVEKDREKKVDLSRLFYGEEVVEEKLFEDEGIVVPVRSGLKWNKPDYAICCMRR